MWSFLNKHGVCFQQQGVEGPWSQPFTWRLHYSIATTPSFCSLPVKSMSKKPLWYRMYTCTGISFHWFFLPACLPTPGASAGLFFIYLPASPVFLNFSPIHVLLYTIQYTTSFGPLYALHSTQFIFISRPILCVVAEFIDPWLGDTVKSTLA